jgi:hypothetical protein
MHASLFPMVNKILMMQRNVTFSRHVQKTINQQVIRSTHISPTTMSKLVQKAQVEYQRAMLTSTMSQKLHHGIQAPVTMLNSEEIC